MIHKTIKTYIVVFLLICILNFALPRLLPGGPIAYLLGGDEQTIPMTQERKAYLLSFYGLDAPLHEQFIRYLIRLLTWDFGLSITRMVPVNQLIASHMRWTLFLVGSASLLSIIFGVFFGLISGWLKHKSDDQFIVLPTLMIGAVPDFILAMTLLLIGSTQLGWFPFGGSATPFADHGSGFGAIVTNLSDIVHHGFLPILTLTMVNMTNIYLLMRHSTVEVLSEAYITTAKAKGLPLNMLLFRHLLKNAFLPIFTLIMLRIGFLFTGAIFVETVYSYPGVGHLLQQAILSRDYPLIHGLFIIFTIAILGVNLIADMLYPKLDPRISRKSGEVFE